MVPSHWAGNHANWNKYQFTTQCSRPMSMFQLTLKPQIVETKGRDVTIPVLSAVVRSSNWDRLLSCCSRSVSRTRTCGLGVDKKLSHALKPPSVYVRKILDYVMNYSLRLSVSTWLDMGIHCSPLCHQFVIWIVLIWLYAYLKKRPTMQYCIVSECFPMQQWALHWQHCACANGLSPAEQDDCFINDLCVHSS